MDGRYLFVGLACLFFSCTFKSPGEYLQEASVLEDQGKLKEAIALLDKAIARDPKYLPAYINRGADESMLGKYDLAIQNYTAAISLSPRNVLALVNRGKNENRLGQYRRALDDFQAAINSKGGEEVYIDLTPNKFIDIGSGYDCPMAEIRLERGVSYYNLDSLNSAFRDFQFCITKQFALGVAYRLRGFVYIAAQQREFGCNDLRKAVELGDEEAKEAERKYCR